MWSAARSAKISMILCMPERVSGGDAKFQGFCDRWNKWEGQPAPPPGTAVHRGAVEVGEIRSTAGDLGLALLRLDAIEAADEAAAPLQAGPSGLTVRKPDWADF